MLIFNIMKSFRNKISNEKNLFYTIDNLINISYKRKKEWVNKYCFITTFIENISKHTSMILFKRGFSKNIKKNNGEITKESLKEEISNIILVVLFLAKSGNLEVNDILEDVKNKLIERENKYRKDRNLPEYVERTGG